MPYEKVGDADAVCIADEVPFEIPESWEWVRLSMIIELQSGQDLTPDKYNDKKQGIPYITGASNIENETVVINRWTEHGRAFAHKGDLLLTCKGTVGTMAFLKEDQVHIARQIMAIKPLVSINSQYIKIVLETLVERLKSVAKSMIPGISREDVLTALFPLPPENEQLRISLKVQETIPIIKAYEKKVIIIKELNTEFPDRLKKSILQSAVMGKLVPQDPNDEPASILLERIRAEKAALIKAGKIKKDKHESVIYRSDNSHYEKVDGVERCIDDEIPFEIPESWCWCRLGTILNKLTDGTHSTPKYTETGVPFISVKDVSTGRLSFENCKYISTNEHRQLFDRCDPEEGDILLTKVGSTGIPAIVDTNQEFSLFVSVALLKFSKKSLDIDYLMILLKSPLVQQQATENTKGVGNKNWVIRDIANTLVVLPPLNEQRRIVELTKNTLCKVNLIP